jgi:hypothetical protein
MDNDAFWMKETCCRFWASAIHNGVLVLFVAGMPFSYTNESHLGLRLPRKDLPASASDDRFPHPECCSSLVKPACLYKRLFEHNAIRR